MAAARFYHAVAVLDGKLYAVGGDGVDGYLSSVERYDPATHAWEAVASMGTARSDHGVAMLDGKLYAVGGFDGGRLSSVERYDPAANAWGGLRASGRFNELTALNRRTHGPALEARSCPFSDCPG